MAAKGEGECMLIKTPRAKMPGADQSLGQKRQTSAISGTAPKGEGADTGLAT
jgi:hypothetical protein